jgi:ABC-type transport system substrate-binding protein
VNGFVVQIGDDSNTILDRIQRNDVDWGFTPNSVVASRGKQLQSRYGINRTRFFVTPGLFLRYFALNVSRPLFRNNARLRRAVNFAVDRPALLRARGPFAGQVTDQYLVPAMPGFRDARIYPLHAPNVRKARALARGHLRGGKAVLEVCASELCATQGQILKANLAKIGLAVEIKVVPGNYFARVATRGEPFDIAWSGSTPGAPDPVGFLVSLFDGHAIQATDNSNLSYLNSAVVNRRLAAAQRASERTRYQAAGRLDVDLARTVAPAIAYAYDNQLTFVSKRVGCIVLRPDLDLTAACLK